MSAALGLPAGWTAALQQRLQQPPRRPRVPLLWQQHVVGSVEPDLVGRAPADGIWQRDGEAVRLQGAALTPCLEILAQALRGAGLAHVWRNEQLGVRAADGSLLGTVERAVVRPLGITTRAVHLAGLAPDGRHWIQQRAFDKANDPGLWDTLVGGMVPASDSDALALERETWEEAGLRLDRLQQLRPGGVVRTARPTDDGAAGYIVESIAWWSAVLPDGVVPDNQDGEVAGFRLAPAGEVAALLQQEQFTLEAAGILTQLDAAIPR